MPAPKPVKLTQISAASYEGAGGPQPFVVVDNGATAGEAGLVTTQAAIANQPASTVAADFAGVKVQIDAVITKLNAVLAALRAAGVIAP